MNGQRNIDLTVVQLPEYKKCVPTLIVRRPKCHVAKDSRIIIPIILHGQNHNPKRSA